LHPEVFVTISLSGTIPVDVLPLDGVTHCDVDEQSDGYPLASSRLPRNSKALEYCTPDMFATQIGQKAPPEGGAADDVRARGVPDANCQVLDVAFAWALVVESNPVNPFTLPEPVTWKEPLRI
jgi:hypothetical protein